MLWWNPMYLVFALPPLLLGLLAQAWVRSAYNKGLRVPTERGVTGAQGADWLMKNIKGASVAWM